MKKILNISLVAVLAVTPLVARADIASTGYVTSQIQALDSSTGDTGVESTGTGSFLTGVTITDGKITGVTKGAPTEYTLPDATTSIKGGVIVDGTTITASSGTISVKADVFDDKGAAVAVRRALTGTDDGTTVTKAVNADTATADASGNIIAETYQIIDNMVTKGFETGEDANKYPSVQKVEDMMSAFSGDVTSLQADIELFGDMLDGKVNMDQGTPNAKKIAGTKSDGTVVFATPTVSGDGNVVSSVSVSDAGALTLNKDVTALTAITGTATGSGTVVKGVSASGSTVTATMGTIGDADIAADAKIGTGKIDFGSLTQAGTGLAAEGDGVYGLTATITNGVATLKWEKISR